MTWPQMTVTAPRMKTLMLSFLFEVSGSRHWREASRFRLDRKWRRVPCSVWLGGFAFVVDACEVGKLGSGKVCFNDTLGHVEVHDKATCLHRTGTNAATVARAKTCPTECFVHALFEGVT